MKILIAEDELLERKAMRKFLADNFSDITVIHEAANGREAIEKAKQSPPDIIFMDIKMPGIDGLEAIEKIQEISPFSKYILVSAYDSFDFAKQGMQYGVKEYILKPGRKEEIVTSILRVKREIDQEAQQQEEKRHLMEERLITKLMHHPLESEALTIMKEYFPSFTSGFFLVVQMDTISEQGMIQSRLAKHVEHSFIVDRSDKRIVCCILSDLELSKSDLLRQARKIQLEFGDTCIVGLGYVCAMVEHFPKSYHDALTAAYQLAKRNNRKYGFTEKSAGQLESSGVAVQLLDEVEKGNEHESVKLYQNRRHLLSADDHEELYFNVKRLMEEQNLSLPGGSIAELDSVEAWQQFITLCCLRFQEHYQSKKLMQKVKEYIDAHYKRGITLEEIAEHVGLSPSYFSTIFKRVFGTNFVEFITGRKLNEAKRLIVENEHSLKEISYMVGYNDPNYFSRVFKKHFQLSPKQFQRQIFKK